MASGEGEKVISTNRKARHDYEILETYEAGLVLKGTEVKSLREGQVNFKDSYASIDRGEAWLVGLAVWLVRPWWWVTATTSMRCGRRPPPLCGNKLKYPADHPNRPK